MPQVPPTKKLRNLLLNQDKREKWAKGLEIPFIIERFQTTNFYIIIRWDDVYFVTDEREKTNNEIRTVKDFAKTIHHRTTSSHMKIRRIGITLHDLLSITVSSHNEPFGDFKSFLMEFKNDQVAQWRLVHPPLYANQAAITPSRGSPQLQSSSHGQSLYDQQIDDDDDVDDVDTEDDSEDEEEAVDDGSSNQSRSDGNTNRNRESPRQSPVTRQSNQRTMNRQTGVANHNNNLNNTNNNIRENTTTTNNNNNNRNVRKNKNNNNNLRNNNSNITDSTRNNKNNINNINVDMRRLKKEIDSVHTITLVGRSLTDMNTFEFCSALRSMGVSFRHIVQLVTYLVENRFDLKAKIPVKILHHIRQLNRESVVHILRGVKQFNCLLEA